MKKDSKQLSEETDVVQVANFLGLMDEWTGVLVLDGNAGRGGK